MVSWGAVRLPLCYATESSPEHLTWHHICMWACHVIIKPGRGNEERRMDEKLDQRFREMFQNSEQCMILSHLVLVPAHALQFCSRSGSPDCNCKIAGNSTARCTHTAHGRWGQDRADVRQLELWVPRLYCLWLTNIFTLQIPVILSFCIVISVHWHEHNNSSFSAASKARALNLMSSPNDDIKSTTSASCTQVVASQLDRLIQFKNRKLHQILSDDNMYNDASWAKILWAIPFTLQFGDCQMSDWIVL
jgi:hypothetical protein